MPINHSIAQYIPEKFRSLYYNDKTDVIYFPGATETKRYLKTFDYRGKTAYQIKDLTCIMYGNSSKGEYYEACAKIITSLNNFQILNTPGDDYLDFQVKQLNYRNNEYLNLHKDNRTRLEELSDIPFVAHVGNQSHIRIYGDSDIYILKDGVIRIVNENSQNYSSDIKNSIIYNSFYDAINLKNTVLAPSASVPINDFNL